MTKKELALQYWDKPIPSNLRAVTNKLMKNINETRGLLDALRMNGYNKNSKEFTPKQVEIIYEFLGEP